MLCERTTPDERARVEERTKMRERAIKAESAINQERATAEESARQMKRQTIITASEAARRAGVSLNAILLAILRGRIRARRLGPIWSVDEASLENYIRSREETKAKKE